MSRTDRIQMLNVEDIARELGRSRGTVITMADVMGLCRPRELRYRRRQPAWEPMPVSEEER